MNKQKEEIISLLKKRFTKNRHRHTEVQWEPIENFILKNHKSIRSLKEMEQTGGEPDIIVFEDKIYYCDFSKESPIGRRSLCYDLESLNSRKENKPKGSAMQTAKKMGIELLTEHQYLLLQQIENLDLKTSTWLKTPQEIRDLGGAIFGDSRFGRVFIYHNGASSYYAARGFRGIFPVEIE